MKRTFALLAVFVLLAGLLLASLLLAGGNLPVRADEPEGSFIPRHRVGHRAKVQNLDTLLAEGGDPLAGNHRLVADDEIFLAFKDSQGILEWQYLDVDANLSTPELIKQLASDGDSPAAAIGNFNGDQLDDFVRVRGRSGYEAYMALGYFKDGFDTTYYDFDTGEKVYGFPRVATGDFDGDGQDEIVMAWEGDGAWANLKVYDPDGSIHPAAEYKLHDEQVANGNLDLATGDFDGDGTDEVVLAWIDLGNWMAVKVYDVDHDGTLTAKPKWHGSGGRTVAVATGDFDGDGTDEITTVDGEYIRIFSASSDLSGLTAKSHEGWGCMDDLTVIAVDVAAGDFDTDGQDEIVSSCHEGSGALVYVWASNSDLGLAPKGYWEKEIDYTRQGTLAVGDLNHDLRSEIVLAWAQWDDLWDPQQQHDYLQILQVATDLTSITAKGELDLGEAQVRSQIAVVLGDLDADSVRVGQPTYSRVVEAKQLLATINEPPKHLDEINGITYDVNVTETCPSSIGPPCTYARYENQESQTTEMSLSTSRDWGFSSELEAKAEGIEASLKVSYGEGFEKTTSSLHEVAFGQEADAGDDDVIVRTETDYDVWEYPVYSDTTGTIQGHIAVVFPRKVDPSCTADCQVESTLAHINGKNPLSYYAPNHQNHNLFSYSSDAPGDMDTLIKRGPRIYLGDNVNEFWVDWEDVKEDETKQTKKQEVEFGAGVEEWGIKAKVEGKYSKEQISTHKVSFEQETSIHIRWNEIEPKYSYVVDPYVYWSSDNGHLAVDYSAWPLTASPPTWWQNTYDKPDPAFNLPWMDDPPTPDYELLSKEITFQPYAPTAGEPVTITAKVRNYSLSSVGNVKVRLYQGDPEDGGQQIGSDQTIDELQAMSSQTVTVQFDTSGQGAQKLNIYAVVDPDNKIAEVHDETSPPSNNKAYAILSVKLDQAPGRPVNLAIDSESIIFEPEMPSAGETVHISVTVEAQGDTFAYVGVEFWDGNPRRGGRLIGGELIPMILVGETAAVQFAWDTGGKLGAHDIWVGVDHRARDEDLYEDNWAHRTVNLAPHRLYLPLAFKD